MDNLKILVFIVGGVFLAGAVALGFEMFFAPKFEQVRREVYEESLSYNRGKVEHLNRLCYKLRTAEDGHRDALAAMIRTEAATYEMARLPADLQSCVRSAQ